MRTVKYKVNLSESERSLLKEVLNSSKSTPKEVKRASILLTCDSQEGNLTHKQISQQFGITEGSLTQLCKKYTDSGVKEALKVGKGGPRGPRKVFGEEEAHIIALACSQDYPEGYSGWTLSLLRDEMIRLKYIDSISREKVRQVLKKTKSTPRKSRNG